jgi:integrase
LKLARRRYQQGTLFLRGKREKVWVGRWREDEITQAGILRRINRKEVIGTVKEYPTKRLAQRELQARIAPVNNPSYRPQISITLTQFFDKWKLSVLPQYKQSTQHHLLSDINHHLLPALGDVSLKDITSERLQGFVAGMSVGPKTVHNIVAVLRSLWRTAKAWGYVAHDPFAGLVLPEVPKPQPRCFTLEEVLRIIREAQEPYKTFYWLAAETGMRAGELCALRWEDVELERGIVHVRQSAWREVMQTPKTSAGRRSFAISPAIVEHLRKVKPNRTGLIFLNKLGRPWKGGKIVEKHLYPLLDRLDIPRRGLHAFRHLNGSLMDQFGAPMKVRQERLGHSTASMTLDGYTHSVGEDHRRIATQLGGVLCPLVSNSGSGASS